MYDCTLAFEDQKQGSHSLVRCHSGKQMWAPIYGWDRSSARHAHVTSTVSLGPAVLGDTVAGRITDPEGVHTLIPGTCEYGILRGKRHSADVTTVTVLETGRSFRIIRVSATS